jgi:hypothetical protein
LYYSVNICFASNARVKLRTKVEVPLAFNLISDEIAKGL